MPIGAAIGAVASVGGAFLGSSSVNKAASKAADTSLAVADKNNAFAENIYNQNQAALSPFMQRGNAAGDQLNAMLGLGVATQQPATQPAQSAFVGSPAYNQSYGTQTSGANNWLAQYLQRQQGQMFQTGDPAVAYQAPQTAAATQDPQQAANDAFDTFRNSTGYQFRLGEGMNALNSGYAGSGVLQSGAAMKDALRYGQEYASNEFGQYAGLLANQQGVGLSGASALAGVGQNYANSVAANNNNAGSAVANAALVKGQNNPFASVLGTIGGGILGGL